MAQAAARRASPTRTAAACRRASHKKLYGAGQRFPLGYGHRWGYDQIPNDLRSRYGFDPRSNYYYGDGYLYGSTLGPG